MKLLFIDLETTGTMHWRNGIHRISGMIQVEGEVKETFDFKVKPFERAQIEDEALKVSGVTRQDLETYAEMKDTYDRIIKMLGKYVNKFNKTDKFHLVGYNNASFDNQFFRAFFVQCGDQYFGSWFWSSSIDVMVLAAQHLIKERQSMKDFKLHTVAAHCSITVDESRLHDSLYDIDLTKQIYDCITSKPHAHA